MGGREKLRVGLIGTGKHGTRYARHIRDDCPEVEIGALCRREEAKLAAAVKEFGGRPYTDYRELIASPEVEAVIAVLPPTFHLSIVAAAAERGVPLLLEKPAAPNLRVGGEMVRILRARPFPVMVAQTLRYNAVVRALKARLPEIGALHAITLSQRFEPSPLTWLDDPRVSGGGMTLHTGVHLFDLVRFFTGGAPRSVTCQMHSVHTERTEDGFAATLHLESPNALVTASCARTAGARNGHIGLAGEQGALVGDHVLHNATRVVGTTAEAIELGAPSPTVREVIRDFARAVREGTPMPIPLAEGLRAVAVVDACYAAWRTGAVTAVDSTLFD
jgi:predicted dehydrogenase